MVSRKPNFDFERRAREKLKVEKAELRAKAKAEKAEATKAKPAVGDDETKPT